MCLCVCVICTSSYFYVLTFNVPFQRFQIFELTLKNLSIPKIKIVPGSSSTFTVLFLTSKFFDLLRSDQTHRVGEKNLILFFPDVYPFVPIPFIK